MRITDHLPRPSRRAVLASIPVTGAALLLADQRSQGYSATPATASSMPAAVRRRFGWRPALNSPFTTMSALDPKLWGQGWFPASAGAVSGPINQGEQAAYHPRNIVLDKSGAHFRLTATPTRVLRLDGSGTNYPRAGAVITSMYRHDVHPRTWIEARLHLPGTGGKITDWPGFWLNGYDRPGRVWPQFGEIDIVEGLRGYAAWHYHWGTQPGRPTLNPGHNVPGTYTGWHTFAAHWEPDRIDFYYDGRLAGSVLDQVQTDAHYIVLGYSTTNAAAGPSELICESVRSWTHT